MTTRDVLNPHNNKSTVCIGSMHVICMYSIVITYSKGEDQPGKVANPARGQLNRGNEFFPVPVPQLFPVPFRV